MSWLTAQGACKILSRSAVALSRK